LQGGGSDLIALAGVMIGLSAEWDANQKGVTKGIIQECDVTLKRGDRNVRVTRIGGEIMMIICVGFGG
jgi:hypothetical protein